MGDDCIFCKIATGEMDSDVIYRDEIAVAFKDIHPQAPVHMLVAPVEHIDKLSDVNVDHEAMLGHLLHVCALVARKCEIAERGYRVIINCGEDGGQVVPHLHLHVMGGKKLPTMMG